MIDARQIDAALSQLVGLPFERGARGPQAFDCWGLVREVRARLGLAVPPDYGSCDLTRTDMLDLFHSQRPAGWKPCRISNGVIVLSRDAGHAGVHLMGRILHCEVYSGVGVWSFGRWTAMLGPLECWEAVNG